MSSFQRDIFTMADNTRSALFPLSLDTFLSMRNMAVLFQISP